MLRSPGSANEMTEKKPIGFKRLLDISIMKPPELTLEVSQRPGFWNLLDMELKGDYIVLVVKVLANVYKSLGPCEKSRLSSQLKTRFEKSIFVNTLKKYVAGVPATYCLAANSYEKKMNLQLWNDVELFYKDLIMLCEGILTCGNHNTDFLNEIKDLAEISTRTAAKIWVEKEKQKRIHEQFFSVIEELKLVLSLMREVPIKQVPISNAATVSDPKSFKNLDVFPKIHDLLSDNKLDIQANIINGAYPSVEHYLDLQFKLLREDCFGPLREGIKKYMQNPSKTKFEDIRVYPKAIIIATYMSNNKVGHLVDIAWHERSNGGSVDCSDLAQDKQLMFGSLLLFTCNNFETILCGTVLDSGTNLLAQGYVAVSFHNAVPKAMFTKPYLMVESEVFFEPYHRVLKVLQNSKLDDLPMKRYIVDVQTETKVPAYLTSSTVYTVESPKKSGGIRFRVLDQDRCLPPSYIGLDSTQMEAYMFALTREFAVIQGPPGTGKTFIGIKIASTLLKNISLKGKPMTIICYTNHALDQFLEGILGVTKDIVRLGSQSKSKVLEPYTLTNLRMKRKTKYSYLYARKRSELEGIFRKMTDLQSDIEKCEKEILSLKSTKNRLIIDDYLYKLKTKRINLEFEMNMLLAQHNQCNETLNKITTAADCELMKTTRVVGMTTTIAARRHDLLKKLLSPIVIVEEAAEVLEAHIVASLTYHCQHLILIGDHKQLRPSAAHYKLAKHYNLEVSLFERMIRNGVHARTLTTQRRMRPNFVELLVPEIYEKLDSHPIVSSYPNVTGMKNNLYFFTHDVYEDSKDQEESRSHKNTLEAKWCVALANYLRTMKYKSEEITILSTYTAQVSLIKELSKKYKLLVDVNVTSVDNYQGEENRIVLLSLVRSNRDGKIGFLATENRVCVALSRAREGFYLFGNMKVLKSASSLWRAINDKLVAQKAIGDKLSICCGVHKDVILEVTRPEELDDCTSGSCLKICKDKDLDKPVILIFVSFILLIIRWTLLPVRGDQSQQSQYIVSKNTVLICAFMSVITAYLFLKS